MKLFYLAHAGLLDDWAHTVQIMSMCEAFAKNNVHTTLLVPNRKYENAQDPFAYYGISPLFSIVRVPYVDIKQGSTSALSYRTRLYSFLISARVYLLFKEYDVLYTREIYAGLFFRRIVVEIHSLPAVIGIIYRNIARSVVGIVVLTSHIRSELEKIGVASRNIHVAPDAVRLEDFEPEVSIDAARKELKLSPEYRLFGYVGTLRTLGKEKGVATAIDALQFLHDTYRLYVVGGEREDIAFYQEYAQMKGLAERVFFVGKVSRKVVSLHMSACDVLVAPFPDIPHYRYFMSPLKIFEYMASRRPMIVSDLPSLREVLVPNETALFIPPENPQILAERIEKLCTDSMLYKKLTQNAYRDSVEKYTWKERAHRILMHINNTVR